ncbi:hypothetical protein IKE79_00705 [Candidatus Saccharibacteria bacterium]|nr:hypothetical protein [Candidatus Saccharibacteria bacterium]
MEQKHEKRRKKPAKPSTLKKLDEEFLRERAAGLTNTQIMRKYGVSRKTLYAHIAQIAEANGIERETLLDRPPKKPGTEADTTETVSAGMVDAETKIAEAKPTVEPEDEANANLTVWAAEVLQPVDKLAQLIVPDAYACVAEAKVPERFPSFDEAEQILRMVRKEMSLTINEMTKTLERIEGEAIQ